MEKFDDRRRQLLRLAPMGAAALLVGGVGAASAATAEPVTKRAAKAKSAGAAGAMDFLVKVDSLDPHVQARNSSVIVEVKENQAFNLLGTPLSAPYLLRVARDAAASTEGYDMFAVTLLDAKGRPLEQTIIDETSTARFVRQQISINLRVK